MDLSPAQVDSARRLLGKGGQTRAKIAASGRGRDDPAEALGKQEPANA